MQRQVHPVVVSGYLVPVAVSFFGACKAPQHRGRIPGSIHLRQNGVIREEDSNSFMIVREAESNVPSILVATMVAPPFCPPESFYPLLNGPGQGIYYNEERRANYQTNPKGVVVKPICKTQAKEGNVCSFRNQLFPKEGRMTHRFFTKRWHSVALVALVAMSLVAFGCGTKNESSSLTNPNPNNLNPTGSLQGVLTDSTTGQPIVGAVIDIGVATATTNAAGLYIFFNIPATSQANGYSGGGYVGTIDLRNVTSPVKMNDSTFTGFKYPPTVFYSADVVFSSFDDTSGDQPGSGSGSNHDTPVTGLMATSNFSIGKLASAIDVLVTNSSLVPVGLGYTVTVLLNGAVVATDNTDANGRVLFKNLMAHTDYLISAIKFDKTLFGDDSYVTPGDGKTLTLLAQGTFSDLLVAGPVIVTTTDHVAPKVASTAPGTGADISDTTVLGFLINFSEPIANTTAYASAVTPGAASVSGLWNDVIVNFDGSKAGNIVHSIAWISNTQLGITFPPLSPSSKYSVTLNCNAQTKLKDLNGNAISTATCPDATVDKVFKFTTNTGNAATAATNVVVVGASSIDFNTVAVNLDWPPASGAFAYNVYRSQVSKLGGYAGSETSGAFKKLNAVPVFASQYQDTPLPVGPPTTQFTNGQNQVLYSYQVVSLNSDLNESATSAPVTASDSVKPRLAAPSTAFRTDWVGVDNKLTVFFNEPVDEVSAEVAANYAVLGFNGTTPIAPTPLSAFMNADLTSVTLTLASAMDNNTPFRITTTPHILSGPNGVCNSLVVASDDVQFLPFGQGVYDNSVCLIADNTASPAAIVLGGDDFVNAGDNTVRSGANGVCNTVVQTGWHLGSIAVGNGTPDSMCVRAGPDLILQTVAGSDDVAVHPVIVKVTGVKDVAGNDIDTAGDEIALDGLAR